MNNRKYRIQHDITFLTASMFITICLWIGFNIYNSYVTSTIDDVLQMQIIPIEGNFDVNTIQKLKSRTKINPDFGELIASNEAIVDIAPLQVDIQPVVTITEAITPDDTTIQQPTGVQNNQLPVEDAQ